MNVRLEMAITPKQLKPVYELYFDAFPEIERKPISLIEDKVAEGTSEVFAILDGEEFIGFAIYVIGPDKVLLDFFSILPEKRCFGYGSKVFPLLMNHYEGKDFVLEIEDPDGEVDEEEKAIRRRRKAFYLRMGMVSMPFLINLFGVEMEVLTNGRQIDFPEYHGLIRGVYGPIIDDKILFVKYLDGREGNPLLHGEEYPLCLKKQEDVQGTEGRISHKVADDAGWEVCEQEKDRK